uniref:Kinesin family member 26Ba n=1 Tax=Cyprinus carpio TaxID=7962 RepID=A0A8C2DWQ7_CYPCA
MVSEGNREGLNEAALNRYNADRPNAYSSPTAPPPALATTVPSSGTSAAASFFARAAQKLNLSSKKKKQRPAPPAACDPPLFPTNFSSILQVSPPPAPPCLLRAVNKVKDTPGMGKVKVMVRLCPSSPVSAAESSSFLKVDSRKKQVTIMDPAVNSQQNQTQNFGSSNQVPPKMFAFDAAFSHDASQAEVCAGTVAEVIQSVVNGADGCVFCFGHSKLGKSYTMIGKDDSMQSLGIIPCAISWLFKLINECKEKTGARFSVRVSAVEVWGKDENLKDLLSEVATGSLQDGQSPGVYLCEDPICGMQLQNQSELRAPTAEKAAFFLDAAIAARYSSKPDYDEEEHRNSHMLFTLHIYQYRMEKTGKGGMSGGRSRLHLIDLGSCVKVLSKTRDSTTGLCLSLSALGNVILALVNGSKHIPYKDSKLTMLLRESLGNMNCRTTMIAHISSSPSNFSETLSTLQIASRVLRLKKKKTKQYTSSSSGGESSCEEGRMRRPTQLRTIHSRNVVDSEMPLLHLSSDPEDYSSSEQSCDTVIYVGPNGSALSDKELTDNEGPPEFVPIIPSLHNNKADLDCLKCNTFAELQERLDCIDGREESKPRPMGSPRLGIASLTKTSEYKPPSSPSQRCKVYTQKGIMPGTPPHSSHNLNKDSRKSSTESLLNPESRTSPVGMSPQVLKRSSSSNSLGSAETLCDDVPQLPLDSKKNVNDATVTLEHPLEPNGEDELVLTLVEKLTISGVMENGRPTSIISFNSDCSVQAMASGSRPVSIISSMSEDLEHYTTAPCTTTIEGDPQASRRSSVNSWLSEMSAGSDGNQSCHSFVAQQLNDKNTAKHKLDKLSSTSSGYVPFKTNITTHPCAAVKPMVLQETPLVKDPKSPPVLISSEINFDDPWMKREGCEETKPLEMVCDIKSEKRTSESVKRKWQVDKHSSSEAACSPDSMNRVLDGCEMVFNASESIIQVYSADILRTGSLPRAWHRLNKQDNLEDPTYRYMSGEYKSLGVTTSTPCSPRATLERRSSAGRQGIFARQKGIPPLPPVRKSSLDQRNRASPQHNPGNSQTPNQHLSFLGSTPEDLAGKHKGPNVESSRLFSAKLEQLANRTNSLGRSHGAHYNCQSLERAESLTSLGSKGGVTKDSTMPRTGRSITRGLLSSPTNGPNGNNNAPQSPKANQSKISAVSKLLMSVNRSSSLPSNGKNQNQNSWSTQSLSRSRGTGLVSKLPLKAVNGRISELLQGSASSRAAQGHGASDTEERGAAVQEDERPVVHTLPSPYSKITAPRRPHRCSSGHASDNSSVLSGELPPAMGKTALFYHSGGSSGYESMIRDSEATGSTSSAHDSMSENSSSVSGRRSLKNSKKRSNTGKQISDAKNYCFCYKLICISVCQISI